MVGVVKTTARVLPGVVVLGELEELSISSGESSSSSGRVGMLGSRGGRERVWGKMNRDSDAADEAFSR